MSYIGQGPQFASFPSKFFNGDDSAMTVTLDYAPPNLAALLVFIDGVRQDTSAYTLSGTSLTFTGSVPSGTANVQVVHLGLQVDVGTPGDDTVTNAKLANMAANTVKVRDANSSGDPSDKALATTEILIGDGTGFTAAALSSDVTMTNAGAVTIADNAVSLAKMAGLVRGKIIYGDASGDPAALTVGTNGQALVSDGTDISWGSAGASSLNGLSDCRVYGTSFMVGTDSGDNITGAHNVAMGVESLKDAVGATKNVALGSYAGANVTGGGMNTIVGYDAMSVNEGNWYTTAIGHGAMRTHDTGDHNVAVGYEAYSADATGTKSAAQGVAVGAFALEKIQTPAGCSAVGYKAGQAITTGTKNTAIGHQSLLAETTGAYNCSVGSAALGQQNGGSNNTGVGHAAGNSGTTTADCISIGYSSDASAAGASGDCTLGNSSISNLRCNDTSISSLSDERDKTQILDLPDDAGLEFINTLKPRTFYWDRREWYENNTPDGSKVKSDFRRWKSNSGQQMGFVAQEVQESISGKKYLEDSNMVSTARTETDNGAIDSFEFAPAHLITPLVKAIQQLTARIVELEGK